MKDEVPDPARRAAVETPAPGAAGVPGTARAARPGEMLVSQTGEGRCRGQTRLPGWHGGHGHVVLQGGHVHMRAGITISPTPSLVSTAEAEIAPLACMERLGRTGADTGLFSSVAAS